MLFLSLLILFTGVNGLHAGSSLDDNSNNSAILDNNDDWNDCYDEVCKKVAAVQRLMNLQFDLMREGIDTRVEYLRSEILNLKNDMDDIRGGVRTCNAKIKKTSGLHSSSTLDEVSDKSIAFVTDDDDNDCGYPICNKVGELKRMMNLQFDLLREGIDRHVDDLWSEIWSLKYDMDEVREGMEKCHAKIPTKITTNTTVQEPNLRVFKNCNEALQNNARKGVFKIYIPESGLEPFDALCERDNANVSWLIIQRRQDGSVDFFRNWTDYVEGFGDLRNEFWIGLKKLYALTNPTTQELWFQLENDKGQKAWAKYNGFAIGGESDGYKLKSIGKYSGDAGNSLSLHLGHKWATKDRDNNKCALGYKGAWWYENCHHSNLNGVFGSKVYGQGINWYTFTGWTASLKYAHMAIRPVY